MHTAIYAEAKKSLWWKRFAYRLAHCDQFLHNICCVRLDLHSSVVMALLVSAAAAICHSLQSTKERGKGREECKKAGWRDGGKQGRRKAGEIQVWCQAGRKARRNEFKNGRKKKTRRKEGRRKRKRDGRKQRQNEMRQADKKQGRIERKREIK